MQGIELQQALAVANGRFKLTAGSCLVDQLLAGRNDQVPQPFPFHERPLLKGRAAVQVEAIQKVSFVKRCSCCIIALGTISLQFETVHGNGRVEIEGNTLAGDQQIGAKRLAQAVKTTTQIRARLFLAAVGPEELRQRVTRQRPALAGQIDQQRLGAARRSAAAALCRRLQRRHDCLPRSTARPASRSVTALQGELDRSLVSFNFWVWGRND